MPGASRARHPPARSVGLASAHGRRAGVSRRTGGPRRALPDWRQRRVAARRLALQRRPPRLRLQRHGLSRLGRGGHHLQAASVRPARPGGRRHRGPLPAQDRSPRGGSPPAPPDARAGRSRGERRAGGGRDRADRARLRGGHRREAGGARAAAPARGRGAHGTGQCAPPHRPGPWCGCGTGDRGAPARVDLALGRVPGQRRDVRAVGAPDLAAATATRTCGSGGRRLGARRPRTAGRARRAVRAAAVPGRRDGRVHLRGPDRAAGRVRRAGAGPR